MNSVYRMTGWGLPFLFLAGGTAQASLVRWERAALRQEEAQAASPSVLAPFAQLLSPESRPSEEPAFTAGTFDQKLDPSNPQDTRTFKQRYFVSTAYTHGADAPVLYYVCGEAECSTRFAARLVGDYARAAGATMVALEHRYYGESQPFADYSVEHLRYLRTDFALADLAAFERYAQAHLGLGRKWLVIGGSYAGSLSAFYRLQHPELVVGSLASSAPVEARNNFVEFDYHATVAAGDACAAKVRQVIAKAEASLSDPQALAALKAQFGASDITEPDDFIYLLSDLAAESMQYGKRDELCSKLLASTDPLADYAAYVQSFLAWFGEPAVSFVAQGGLALQAGKDNNARPWFYQSCAEYGYWQNAYPDARFSMRSARINAAYHARLCQRLFGIGEADDSAMNASHYLKLLDPTQASRIFFTNGSDDPWSELSISHLRGNDTNPGTAVQWIDGGSHCSDLRAAAPTDSDSLKAARARFTSLADDWLK